MILTYCEGSLVAALLGEVFFMTSVDLLYIHSMAWSEALAIAFGNLGLFLLTRYGVRKAKILLYLAAGSLGIAALVRYAGVSYGIAAVLWLSVMASQKKFSSRDMGMAVALSLGPLVLWLIRNHVLSGAVMDRPLSYHPDSLLAGLRQMCGTLSSWIVPDSVVAQCPFIGPIAILLILWPWRSDPMESENRDNPMLQYYFLGA